MKKLIICSLLFAVVTCFPYSAYPSDWDKAGIALAVTEGVRVITAGKVDIIGNITGINRSQQYAQPQYCQSQQYYPAQQVRYARRPSYTHRHRYTSRTPRKVWVPDYVWKKMYIPRHEEYDEKGGIIIVEGHYVTCQVESGGHWE